MIVVTSLHRRSVPPPEQVANFRTLTCDALLRRSEPALASRQTSRKITQRPVRCRVCNNLGIHHRCYSSSNTTRNRNNPTGTRDFVRRAKWNGCDSFARECDCRYAEPLKSRAQSFHRQPATVHGINRCPRRSCPPLRGRFAPTLRRKRRGCFAFSFLCPRKPLVLTLRNPDRANELSN